MTTYREGLLAAARVCREHVSRSSDAKHRDLVRNIREKCAKDILALAEQQTLETRQAEDTFGRLVEYTPTERPTDQPAEPKCAAEHGYCVPCGGSIPMDGGCWKEDQRGAAARELPAVKSASRQHEGKADQHSHVTRDDPAHADAPPTLVPVRDSAKQPAQSAPLPDPAGQVRPQTGAGRPQDDARANQAPALPGPETVSVPREPTEAMIDAPRRIILYAETRGRTLQGLREHLDLAGVEFRSWFPEWAISEHGHLTKAAIAILIYRAMLAAGSAK